MGPGLARVLAELEARDEAMQAVHAGPPEVRIVGGRGRVRYVEIGGDLAPFSVRPAQREAVKAAVQAAREAKRKGERLAPESVRVLRAAQIRGIVDSLRHVDALPLDPDGWDFLPLTTPSEGSDIRGEPIERVRALLQGDQDMANALEQKLELELRKTEDAIAIGVVDVDTGMVQGIAPANALPEDVVMQLGDATRRRFDGTELQQIGAIMNERKRRQPPPRYVQWDMWASPNTIHFGRRLPGSANLVVMYVFPSTTTVAAVYSAVAKALTAIDAACR